MDLPPVPVHEPPLAGLVAPPPAAVPLYEPPAAGLVAAGGAKPGSVRAADRATWPDLARKAAVQDAFGGTPQPYWEKIRQRVYGGREVPEARLRAWTSRWTLRYLRNVFGEDFHVVDQELAPKKISVYVAGVAAVRRPILEKLHDEGLRIFIGGGSLAKLTEYAGVPDPGVNELGQHPGAFYAQTENTILASVQDPAYYFNLTPPHEVGHAVQFLLGVPDFFADETDAYLQRSVQASSYHPSRWFLPGGTRELVADAFMFWTLGGRDELAEWMDAEYADWLSPQYAALLE